MAKPSDVPDTVTCQICGLGVDISHGLPRNRLKNWSFPTDPEDPVNEKEAVVIESLIKLVEEGFETLQHSNNRYVNTYLHDMIKRVEKYFSDYKKKYGSAHPYAEELSERKSRLPKSKKKWKNAPFDEGDNKDREAIIEFVVWLTKSLIHIEYDNRFVGWVLRGDKRPHSPIRKLTENIGENLHYGISKEASELPPGTPSDPAEIVRMIKQTKGLQIDHNPPVDNFYMCMLADFQQNETEIEAWAPRWLEVASMCALTLDEHKSVKDTPGTLRPKSAYEDAGIKIVDWVIGSPNKPF